MDPDRRYSSAERLDDELHRLERSLPIDARPLGHAARGARRMERNPLVVAVIASLLFSTALAVLSLQCALEVTRENERLGWPAHWQALHIAGVLARAPIDFPRDDRSEALLDSLEAEPDQASATWTDLPEAEARPREVLAHPRERLGVLAAASEHAPIALDLARNDSGFDSSEIVKPDPLLERHEHER